MSISEEEEKSIREKIRKELEEKEREKLEAFERDRKVKEEEENESKDKDQKKRDDLRRLEIADEEKKKYYKGKGFIPVVDGSGNLIWLSPAEYELKKDRIKITAIARIEAKTGCEMEALTGVAVAALTIYDMCKSVDKNMVISDIRLVRKIKR